MLFQRFFFLGLLACLFTLVRGSPVSTSFEDSSAFPSLMEFERRQSSDTGSSSKGFYWPRIDGPLEEAIGLLNATPPVLTVGYWYYTTVFDKVFMEIGQKNQSQALQFLYNQMVKNQQLFYDTCVETTNATANAAQRTNTVARVVCFPNSDPNIAIDKLQLANPVDFGCWERDVNGNPNTPLYDSTLTVLQKLQWDRQSAIVKIQQIIKDLGVDDPQLTS